MKSIRHRLLLGLSLAALCGMLGGGFILYKGLRREANALSDQQLQQVALTLPNLPTRYAEIAVVGDPEEVFYIQAWDDHATLAYASPAARDLPRALTAGLSSMRVNRRGWRVYGVRRGGRYLQVSQPNSVRAALAARLVLRVMVPLLLVMPLIGILIFWLVGRTMRPLERMADAVSGRSATSLEPLLLDGLSPELQPVMEALNGLLARIRQALEAQQDFIADAAHELRSPLAAIELQLRAAERACSDAERLAAFGKLQQRVDRTSHLVRQLLTLARHGPGQGKLARRGAVDLRQLAQQAVVDHSSLAEQRSIDLGLVSAPGPLLIKGDPDGLGILLSNLLDNALRYTHEGGQVDVVAVMEAGRPLLRVRDNGPGVPRAVRNRLGARFYRPQGNQAWGCGLGMAIVKSVADSHDALVVFDAASAAGGFQVSVHFTQ